jgi:galactokinase
MAENPATRAKIVYRDVFGDAIKPDIAVAPGRINLIGEHTDYNGGFVLPMAVDRNVAVAFSSRADAVLRVHSTLYGVTEEAEIDQLNPPGGHGWFDYVASVSWAMREAGIEVKGADMVLAGDVPVGAGLASSAALELAVARALACASEAAWDPVMMASVCQNAENSYVGVKCGIMDQFAASLCVADSALLLDCRTLDYTTVTIPSEVRFVVMDTGVRRKLADSEYNDRRRSCEEAVTILSRADPRVISLRDVDAQMLASAAELLDDLVLRRATHVVHETQRPVQMADAFRERRFDVAGWLMNESHESLRDLYEVSCRELDLITEIARDCDACFGARMTGAGFGGCAVALVSTEQTPGFVAKMTDEYRAAGGTDGVFNACVPSAGAAILGR